MERKRLKPALRKEAILNAAIELAEADGLQRITRDRVAAAAGVSMGLVSHYYKTVPQLRRDIMRRAISQDCYGVIAQGLILRDKHALKIPKAQQRHILNAVAEKL